MVLEPFNRDFIQTVTDVDTGETLNFPGMFPKQNFANMRKGLAIENPGATDPDKMKVDFDPQEKGKDNTFVQFVGDPASPTVYRDIEDDWNKTTWRLGGQPH